MIPRHGKNSIGISGHPPGYPVLPRWLYLTAGFLVALPSCKDSGGTATTEERSGGQTAHEKVRKLSRPDTGSKGAVGLLVESIDRSSGGKNDLASSDIRRSIERIATETGRSNAEVLVELFSSSNISDTSITAVQDAFLDRPEDFAIGAWEGLGGKQRSGAISDFSNALLSNADEGGLEKFYETLPPSDDRTNVAGTFAKLIAARDFGQGIREIESFDYPEERRRSLTHLAIQLRQSPEAIYADQLQALLDAAKKDHFEAQCRALAKRR